MAARLALFATASRGTEPILAAELQTLGATRVRQGRGGVGFLANLDEAVRIALWSRVAMRLLYPLGEFTAEGADGLYEAASTVPWEEWLTPATTFAVEASLKDAEHTHSGFVALKLKDAVVDRMRRTRGARPDVDSRAPKVQIVARLVKSQLSLSLDLCGEPLFKRGWRTETTPAPLKETLAAAVLLAIEYDGSEPLVDPMCGSGTLAIEAACIATRRAPGARRRLAVEEWPSLSHRAKAIAEEVRREARATERAAPCPIVARDRDPDALAATTRNIAAARLPSAPTVECADATKSRPPEVQQGLVAANPPYGDRLSGGGQKGMKTFYFQLGETFALWSGWRLAFLCGNPAFESAFHRRPSATLTLWNGPIECKLLQYGSKPKAPLEPDLLTP